MGNVAWNSREIYSAKKPLHVCTLFSLLVMTQTSALMLWAEGLYAADRGGGKKKQLILNFGIFSVNCSSQKKKKKLTSATSEKLSVQFKTDYLGPDRSPWACLRGCIY